jgi:pullulanase/glycogen debranching enzyme
MTKKPKTVPLGTQISQEHWLKLAELKNMVGLNKNAAIEQGIDLVYEHMVQAGLLVNDAPVKNGCDVPGCKGAD